MRGLIYPLVGLLVVLVVVAVVLSVAAAMAKKRRKHAIRKARWEAHTSIVGDGMATVGVRRVARWGRHFEVVLRSEEIATVHVDSDDLLEAQGQAVMRAGSYNSILPDGR